MSEKLNDEKQGLNSTMSSDTLVSIGSSAPIFRQPPNSTRDSFYERTVAEDDEVSALNQWLRLSSSQGSYNDRPLTASYSTNWGTLRYHFGKFPSRFEDQDAVPHPSHSNKRVIATQSLSPSFPASHCPLFWPDGLPEKKPLHKLVVLGDKGVGKRSFTTQVSIPY